MSVSLRDLSKCKYIAILLWTLFPWHTSDSVLAGHGFAFFCITDQC